MWGLVVSALIGLGTTAYQTYQNNKDKKELEDDAAEAERVQQESAQKSFDSQGGDTTAKVDFGSGDKTEQLGSYDDFLLKPSAKKKKPALGVDGSSTFGLGIS